MPDHRFSTTALSVHLLNILFRSAVPLVLTILLSGIPELCWNSSAVHAAEQSSPANIKENNVEGEPLLSEAKAKAESEAAAAQKAKEEEEARAEEATKAVEEAWTALLATHNARLSGILEHSATLKESLPSLSSSIRQSLSMLEQEFEKLNTLSHVSGGMPSDLTVMVERLNRIKDRIRDLTAPLQNTLEELSKEKQALDILSTSLMNQQGINKDITSRLKTAEKNISALQKNYAGIMTPAQTLTDTVQTRINTIMQEMPELWNNYYFQSSGHFYDIVAWAQDIHNLSSLKELFSLRLTTELPNAVSALTVMLLRIAATLALFFLASHAIRSLIQKKFPAPMQNGIIRVLKNSMVWIILGIAIHISAWADGKLYQMIATLGTMCLCWGQMLLAWDLYSFEETGHTRLSPLWPMFPSLLIGMILLNFDPFPLFICIVWLIVQGFDLWKAHKRELPDQPLPRMIMRLYAVQLWITFIISLVGFARLSILISMCFTSIAVTTMLCVSIIKVENLVESHLPKEGSVAVMSSLIMALVMPLVLLLSVMAAVLWILAYPGGYFLLQHMATLGFSVGDVSLNAMQILSIFIAFYLTRALLAVGNTFMSGMQKQISRISISLLAPIQIIYKCLLWGCFGLYALNALGFNLSSLSMIAGGLSVGIGIGLQNMVQNFSSGLSVIFGQTIREGDIVEVTGITGVVKKINIRSTMVETFDNAVIFIPNSNFLNGSFTNWTHNNRRVRKEISVGVAYGSPITECMELLTKIAREHPKVLMYPAPTAYFTEFGASSLDLLLRFWVREYTDAMGITSEIRLMINETFTKHGIEISFPQMDIHMRADSELALRKQDTFSSEQLPQK